MKPKSLHYLNGAWLGLLAAGSMSTSKLPIGVEEMLREPARIESRAKLSNEQCTRAAPRVAAVTKARRPTVGKVEKGGFKLFKWL